MKFDDYIETISEGLLSKGLSMAALGSSLLFPYDSGAAVKKTETSDNIKMELDSVNIVKNYLKNRTSELDKLVYSLALKESSFDPFAKGDLKKKFKAYGILQIRQPMLDEYNRITGKKMKESDVFPKSKSKEDVLKAVDNSVLICKTYLKHHGKKIQNVGVKELAGMWNGGPKGKLSNEELTQKMTELGKPEVAKSIIDYRNKVANLVLINKRKLQSEI